MRLTKWMGWALILTAGPCCPKCAPDDVTAAAVNTLVTAAVNWLLTIGGAG